MGPSTWRRGWLAALCLLGAPAALAAACRTVDPDPAAAEGPGGGSGQVAGGESGGAAVPQGKALVIFGTDTVVAEVASTPEQRERGLMYRRELPAGTGMLFVFPDAAERSFWMSNVFVALDVAFMDESLRVTGITRMQPETTDYHDSTGPMMYGLEVPQGWFAAHGIRVGDRARLVMGTR